MSGKRTKRNRRVIRKQLKGDFFELYNALCSDPLKLRIKTAWRILRGKKLRG